jgi:hypothetical protein
MKAEPSTRRFVLAANFFRGDTGGQRQRAKQQCEPQARLRHPEASSGVHLFGGDEQGPLTNPIDTMRPTDLRRR